MAAPVTAAAATGWGSFHSDPVELLIQQTEAEYSPPPVPVDIDAQLLILQQLSSPAPSLSASLPSSLPPASYVSSLLSSRPLPSCVSSSPLLPLGIKSRLFHLSPSFTFLNHGAFGCSLSALTVIHHRWHEHLESQPLRFMDRELLPLLVLTIRSLAAFLHCEPAGLVLLQNATTALTCVARSMAAQPAAFRLSPAHSVLRLNVAYGAVKKQVDWLCEQTGAALHEVTLSFPLRHPRRAIVQLVREAIVALRQTRPVSVAFFDHVTSNTALLLPLAALLSLCREEGVLSVVDGAHAPWQLELDLQALGPDLYTGNAHKWACNPKGAAFLYCSGTARLQSASPFPPLRSLLQPACISHGYGSGFTSNFLWDGCHSYAPLLCLLSTVGLWQSGLRLPSGELFSTADMRRYCAELCRWAAGMLCHVLHTQPLLQGEGEEEEADALCMRCVAVGWGDGVSGAGDRLQQRLYADWSIECPIKTIDGRLYARISAHIHNTPQDFCHLAHALSCIQQDTK